LDDSDFDSADNSPRVFASVTAARWMFVLLGVIWLLFGVWSLTRISEEGGNLSSTMLGIMAMLMFVNAAVLIWIGWGIGKGQRLFYYFGLLVLAGNIFLTLTDEFGIFDLVTLIINASLLALLIVTRSKYLTNLRSEVESPPAK
jgi:hypothetical protein